VEEAVEGGDAGARADHDAIAQRIGGRAEMGRWLQEDARFVVPCAVGQTGGGDALAMRAILHPADHRDGKLDLVGEDFGAGGDGIEARLQGFERIGQILRAKRQGRGMERIDHLAAPEPCFEILLVLGREEGAKAAPGSRDAAMARKERVGRVMSRWWVSA
jgi:hypothetical protein